MKNSILYLLKKIKRLDDSDDEYQKGKKIEDNLVHEKYEKESEVKEETSLIQPIKIEIKNK